MQSQICLPHLVELTFTIEHLVYVNYGDCGVPKSHVMLMLVSKIMTKDVMSEN